MGRKPSNPINREVTINEFIEYNECPNKYILTSIHGKPSSSNVSYQQFLWLREKAVKAVNDFAAHFFFHKMYMNNTLPIAKRLKYWEKLWFIDNDTSSLATNPFSVTYENFLNINTSITKGILDMDIYFDKYDVVSINERVYIASKHNFLSIPIPILLRNKEDETKSIWMFSHLNKPNAVASSKNAILFKAMSAAFECSYNEQLPVYSFLLGAGHGSLKEYKYIPDKDILNDVVLCLENMYNKEVSSYPNSCFTCGHRRIKGRCEKYAT